MALSRKGLYCYKFISRFSSLTTARSSSYLSFLRQRQQVNALHNSFPTASTSVIYWQTSYLSVNNREKESAKMSSPTDKNEQVYKCPSRLLQHFSDLVILDTATSLTTFYDCPVSSGFKDSMEAPTNKKDKVMDIPGINSPAKEAKLIMRIRHKKMKRHKLKKLRKRMYFLWSRQKKARKAKRMAKYYKELEEIKKTGDEFDAESFVKEQLAKARKGGFFINVFESKSL
ncbi:hypothetical protein Btru_049649 [Bulinus truncatus]|nr:hypothetical protein Btru_049649 [Bulinus truncatus]